MTPRTAIRDITARRGSTLVYAKAEDELATAAQMLRHKGAALGFRIVRQRAFIARRAYLAEIDDPEPIDRPWCDCTDCSAYLGRS